MNINPIKWYKDRQMTKAIEAYKIALHSWNLKYTVASGVPDDVLKGTAPGKLIAIIISCTMCNERVNGDENMCVCKPQCEW